MTDSNMRVVKDVFRRNVVAMEPTTNMRELAGRMRDEKVGHVLIQDGGGGFAGIVTESDFVHKVVAADRIPYVVTAQEVMSSPLLTVDIGASVFDAQDVMDKHHVLHLAVTERGAVVGMVSIRDLIHPYEHFDPGSSWV